MSGADDVVEITNSLWMLVRPSREMIAAMAMQGCLALPSKHRTPEVIAAEAVLMADALLAALAKP